MKCRNCQKLKDTLAMCLHWAERDLKLYESTTAPEQIKDAMRHRLKVISDAIAPNAEGHGRAVARTVDPLVGSSESKGE